MSDFNENPYASPLAEPVEGEEGLYQKQLGDLWYQRALIGLGCGFAFTSVTIATGGIGYAVWGDDDPPQAFLLVHMLSFLAAPLCLIAGNILGLLAPAERGVQGWSIGGLAAIAGAIVSIFAAVHWPLVQGIAALSCFFAAAICGIYWLKEEAEKSRHLTRVVAARVAQGFLLSGFLLGLFAIVHANAAIGFTLGSRVQTQKILSSAACVMSAIGCLVPAITAFMILGAEGASRADASLAASENTLPR